MNDKKDFKSSIGVITDKATGLSEVVAILPGGTYVLAPAGARKLGFHLMEAANVAFSLNASQKKESN